MSARDVCIVGYARTPMGGLSGSLASQSAHQLGSVAIKGALARAGVEPALVESVYMGNVLEGGVGQGPARQAALGAGIPNSAPCTAVNKVCASGMKAIAFAAQEIMLGHADCVVAGGMESMTNAPYFVKNARGGCRMGNAEFTDGMIHDGLWDPFGNQHMGNYAEIYAEKYELTRENQDDFALESYRRAKEAWESHAFDPEIVPVVIKTRVGETTVGDDDEYKRCNPAKFRTLRPPFKRDGTVTAGNASAISDGGAAMVLMSREAAERHGKTILATIKSWADAAHEPEMFGTAPSLAIPKALQRAGVTAEQIDFYEINEAFSSVALANMKILGLDVAKVNVYGGAVALGHPLGCSGARIVCTLLNVLTAKGARVGCAGICNGGGGASAMVIERA